MPRPSSFLSWPQPCCADAEEGGETAFPHSRWLDKEKQTAGKAFSNCAKDGVAALARKGNASASAAAHGACHAICSDRTGEKAGSAGIAVRCLDSQLPSPLCLRSAAVMFWDAKPGSMRQDKWSMHTGVVVVVVVCVVVRRRRPACRLAHVVCMQDAR